MVYETTLVDRRGATALVILNRPAKLNAMSLEMKSELVRALRALDSDPSVRVLVITGAGEKAFAAGADVSELAGRTTVEQWRMGERGTPYDAVDALEKPVLAAINGLCLGGGLELALACDIRVASERAELGQTEVNLGLIPGGGASQRLPRLVGLGPALRLALTGDRVDAREALRLGLVDEVVPHGKLLDRCLEIAERIASKSAVAVRLAKAAVRASAQMPLDSGVRYEKAIYALAMGSEDKEEGVRAFSEKRAPAWKDR